MKDFTIILEKTETICENTLTFTFDAGGTGYKFDAGQYAHFTLIDPKYPDEKGNSRALSFANAPNDSGILTVAVRINSSVFINNLLSMNPGSKLFVSKPNGTLTLPNDASFPAVFISGGIGITPVRSIIEDAINKRLPHELKLFYSNKKENQAAFMEDFIEWENKSKKFKFIPVIEDPENKNRKYEAGVIDMLLLSKYLNDIKNKIYYVTGPPVMVDSVKELLLSLNVETGNIRTEKFK